MNHVCSLHGSHVTAGVSKCGTTDLYKKLLEHPSIVDSTNKGPHFWDESHTFDWYLDVYEPVAKATVSNPQIVAGDASTNTFTYSGVGIRYASMHVLAINAADVDALLFVLSSRYADVNRGQISPRLRHAK